MFYNCFGETANDIWEQAYKSVTDASSIETRGGRTKEILHATMSINNPLQKWITCKVPPMSIGYALAELIWILSGSDDAQTINFWNPALPKYAGDYNNYPGAYGSRIMYRYGFNQLERVYHTFKNCPESRQVVVLIWDPKIDLPKHGGIPNNNDIPCNICSLLKVREQKLEWMQIMRSNDLVLGLPYNLVQFTSIQEILASWLNIEVGTYNHVSDSLHIYEKNEPSLGIQRCDITNTDSLKIDKRDFEGVINKIYSSMFDISHTECDESKLLGIAMQSTGYEAYDNILRVICTYAAYKMHLEKSQEKIISECTNPIYQVMWLNWLESKAQGGK